jgi:hypothetical protein
MKKKPAKNKAKLRKSPPAKILSLLQKVKQQLDDFKTPLISLEARRGLPEEAITKHEYKAMDRTMSMMEVHPKLFLRPQQKNA